MFHVCCVPGCSTRSNRVELSFFSLPLKDKKLLKEWIRLIRRTNVPINPHTRICSKHFARISKTRKPPKSQVASSTFRSKTAEDRDALENTTTSIDPGNDVDEDPVKHAGIQVDTLSLPLNEYVMLKEKVAMLEKQVKHDENLYMFRLSSIEDDDEQVAFYTGFSSYSKLKAVYDFLGPSVEQLKYCKKQDEAALLGIDNKRLCKRSLPSLEEFFMTLVRLRLDLLEQDLAYRFNVSQPTVSRITVTWINFLYLQFKELPLWPGLQEN